MRIRSESLAKMHITNSSVEEGFELAGYGSGHIDGESQLEAATVLSN